MAVTEALSLLLTWWAAPIARPPPTAPASASPRTGSPLNFATHGITPLGYAAFAFALGVTAGVLIRRTVPAMAVTLAIFAALQIAMPLWVRPNLVPPATRSSRSPRRGPPSRQNRRGRHIFTLFALTSPASPAPGSCPADPSTPPGIRSAPPRPPAHR